MAGRDHAKLLERAIGTDARTRCSTPVTARRLFDNGDLTFVVPFTGIRGNGGVVIVDGMPSGRSGSTRPHEAARRGPARLPVRRPRSRPRSVDSATSSCAVATTPSTSEAGYQRSPFARTSRCRLPAWNAAWVPDGQTRAWGWKISRTIVGGLTAMVDGGYTIIGDQAGYEFNNSWWYDVALARTWRATSSLSVFLEQYRSLVPGFADAREAVTTVSVKSGSGWRMQFSGSFGLSDGAPDRGFTFGASRRF